MSVFGLQPVQAQLGQRGIRQLDDLGMKRHLARLIGEGALQDKIEIVGARLPRASVRECRLAQSVSRQGSRMARNLSRLASSSLTNSSLAASQVRLRLRRIEMAPSEHMLVD